MELDNFQKAFIEDPYFKNYRQQFYGKPIPLIIDNGSFKCRVGWATEKDPRLQVPSLVGKVRGKKEGEPSIVVGNDIRDNDLSRIPMRSPFEQNVVYHFDTQELIFDYAFEHLGIDNDRINHPILLTEPVCNPNYSRKLMSELLFESYRVPSVCYGIDGLFSFYNQSYNQKKK